MWPYSPDPVDRSHPLNQDRIAWWLGLPHHSGGRSLYDLTGRHPGALANSPAWSTGAGGFAGLTFNGSNSRVDVTTLSQVLFTDSPGFAISGWFRPTTLDGGWKTIIIKDGFGRQFFIGINGGFSCPTNGLSMFTNATGAGAVGTNALTANRWYWFFADHFSAVSGNRLAVWSAEGGWETVSPGSASPTNTAVDFDYGVNGVLMGAYTGPRLFFAGQIADLSIWGLGDWPANRVFAQFEQSRRGYRGPDSPLRWVTTRSYLLPRGGSFVPAFVPAFASGFGWG